MELPNQFWEMAEHLMEVVRTGTGFPVVVYDHEGIIAHATDPTRIGDLHAGAQKIMQGLVDEYAVTPEEAAHNPLVREGYNCPIEIDGRRVAAFGITGKLDRTKPLARVAVKLLDAWIADQKHKAELEASEQKYFKVFNNSPVWVVLSSLKTGRYIEVNETFLRATGYAREEVIGRTSEEIDTWMNHDERRNLKDGLQDKGARGMRPASSKCRKWRPLACWPAESPTISTPSCLP